jgi:hypothetical protein
VFENTVLRRIFELKREEETRSWRRLHNEELHTLYSSSNIIRVIKFKGMGGACSTLGRYDKFIYNIGSETSGEKTKWDT